MMERSSRASALPAWIGAALLLRASGAYAQCAMCGTAAASNRDLARGIGLSVFFLLGALLFVVAWFVVLVYRTQARASRPPVAPGAPGGVRTGDPAGIATGRAPAEE